MAEMSKKEIRKFLMQGTFTGKLGTVKKDGSSHIVPIWFVLDGGKKSGGSRKGDDHTPPFSFVIVYGTGKIHHCKQSELFRFATKIAQRYMGKENAELYGKRNSTEGEVLVRIKPTRIIAEKDVAGWD